MTGNQRKSARSTTKAHEQKDSLKHVTLRQNQKKYLDTIFPNTLIYISQL